MMRRLKTPFVIPYSMLERTNDWFAVKMIFSIDQRMSRQWEKMAINASPLLESLRWLNEKEIRYRVEIEDDQRRDRNGEMEPGFRYVLVMEEMDAVLLRFAHPELIVGPQCSA